MRYVRVLILFVQLAEGHQLNRFLNERLDHRNTRKVFLSKVGERGERRLTRVPSLLQMMIQNRADSQQKEHRYQREECEYRVHRIHLSDSHKAEEKRVAEHNNAPTEAVLNGFKVVGEEGHKVAHLIDLIILLGEILAVIEHTSAQVSFHSYCRAAEADSPQKAAYHKREDNEYHRQTEPVKQKIYIEWEAYTVHLNESVVYSVYSHTVYLGYQKLNVVHHHESYKTYDYHRQIPYVIPIYMFTEKHVYHLFFAIFRNLYYYIIETIILQDSFVCKL